MMVYIGERLKEFLKLVFGSCTDTLVKVEI